MKELLKQLKSNQSGQIMSEYAIMLVMFIGVALMMMLLMTVFTEYTWRLVSLVGLEYP